MLRPFSVDQEIDRCNVEHCLFSRSQVPTRARAFGSKGGNVAFKTTRIYQLVDRPRNTIIYLAISTKIINGSPANAISTVPIIQWQR
jgi:CreA protein